ncbi:MAG: hypothetical protein K0V04_02365 [Deltaproteobacteria bacterium]|nr:hypothetical protein [Deltaproteobacteria bacterium]
MTPGLAQSLNAAVLLVGLAALAWAATALVRTIAEARTEARSMDLRCLRAQQGKAPAWKAQWVELATALAPLLGIWLGTKLGRADEEEPFGADFVPRCTVPPPPPFGSCSRPRDAPDDTGSLDPT